MNTWGFSVADSSLRNAALIALNNYNGELAALAGPVVEKRITYVSSVKNWRWPVNPMPTGVPRTVY